MAQNREDLRVIFAGFGGQGLLFAGKVVAYAGLLEKREVSWLPSYGPEMRGGTASCSVVISDDPIGSPLVTTPTALIAMNQPSLVKFEADIKPSGIAIVDTSLIEKLPQRKDITTITCDATNQAEKTQLKGLANIVLVGVLMRATRFCAESTLEEAIRRAVPPSKAQLVEKNIAALKLGMRL